MPCDFMLVQSEVACADEFPLGLVPEVPSALYCVLYSPSVIKIAILLVFEARPYGAGSDETGNTGAILGHPASGIAWLANALALYGVGLKAGHIVLPGTCTRSRKIGGHREVKGRIESLGEVTLTLSGAPHVKNTELF